MARWIPIVALIASWMTCVARPVEAGSDVGGDAAVARRVLASFESERPGALGLLDVAIPAWRRGTLAWERIACRRDSTEGHCLRLTYALGAERAQASFRVDLGDVDASRFDRLELWIRGDESRGFGPAVRVGLRRPKDEGKGAVEDGTAVIDGIDGTWKRVLVPLSHLAGIHDWRHLSAFFVTLDARRVGAARTGAYEIDDVALLATGAHDPRVDDPVPAPRRAAWERSVGGPETARRIVRAELTGWPDRLIVERDSLPPDDRQLLERIARDTWHGLVALTNRENGLPVDHVELRGETRPSDDSAVADYTNITNVGLHLVAVAAAYELGLVSEPDAVARIGRVLDTLDRLETHQGFFFNYYDTTVLERTSNFVSFVDSSWLTAGLMVVRSTFPALAARATARIDAQDYRFFYDDVAEQMSHGYYVNVPTRSEYHYGALFTEARLGSLIAIGRGDVPEEHWFALVRTYPPEASWQTQRPGGTLVKRVRGHLVEAGTYAWRGERYVPSWGGSMFEALMPALVVDERRFAPRSLGRNDETHARVQRFHATRDLGYPVWGLSPAVRPDGRGYGEYGAKMLGTLGYGGGAVAPYAAALALEVLPEESIANLRELIRRYDVYGPYGFYDAVDPKTGAVARQYLALDQSMVLIAIANHLRDHCIQRRFAADPIAAKALPMLADEDFLE